MRLGRDSNCSFEKSKDALIVGMAVSIATMTGIMPYNEYIRPTSSVDLNNVPKCVHERSVNSFEFIGNNGDRLEYTLQEGKSMELCNVDKNLKLLDSFMLLEDNWNGYGACAFDSKHLERVKGIVVSLLVQPEVFPTAENSIQLEYENDRGDYLEFELFADDKIQMYLEENGVKKLEKSEVSLEEMNGAINVFTKTRI